MNFALDQARAIRALRLIIALAAGIITAHLLKIPMSGWVSVTTTVVLFDQETVGGITFSCNIIWLINCDTLSFIFSQ